MAIAAPICQRKSGFAASGSLLQNNDPVKREVEQQSLARICLNSQVARSIRGSISEATLSPRNCLESSSPIQYSDRWQVIFQTYGLAKPFARPALRLERRFGARRRFQRRFLWVSA